MKVSLHKSSPVKWICRFVSSSLELFASCEKVFPPSGLGFSGFYKTVTEYSHSWDCNCTTGTLYRVYSTGPLYDRKWTAPINFTLWNLESIERPAAFAEDIRPNSTQLAIPIGQ
eukprot:6447312-Pyramimonas_sp.AAC.1